MRYVLVAAAFGLSAPLSGCTSDNMDYVGVFQPGFYNSYGLPLDFNGSRARRATVGYPMPDKPNSLHRLELR